MPLQEPGALATVGSRLPDLEAGSIKTTQAMWNMQAIGVWDTKKREISLRHRSNVVSHVESHVETANATANQADP